jgi:excisionase family DNA binding protein
MDINTPITFEQLPAAISLLLREVNSIKLALQQTPQESDQLLNVAQAAEFLSLAKPTIYAMTSKGELTNLKRGKKVYFQKSDLMEYLKAGKRKSYKILSAETRK